MREKLVAALLAADTKAGQDAGAMRLRHLGKLAKRQLERDCHSDNHVEGLTTKEVRLGKAT